MGAAIESRERSSGGVGGAGDGRGDESYGDADVFAHESRFIGPAAGGSLIEAVACIAAVCEPGDDRQGGTAGTYAAATGYRIIEVDCKRPRSKNGRNCRVRRQ